MLLTARDSHIACVTTTIPQDGILKVGEFLVGVEWPVGSFHSVSHSASTRMLMFICPLKAHRAK